MKWGCLPLALLPIAVCAPARAGVAAPAEFRADLVYLHPRLANGVTLNLYTDSGGGGSILTQAAAARAGLSAQPVTDEAMKQELGPDVATTTPLAFAPGQGVPAMPAPVMVVRSSVAMRGWPDMNEGLVGQNWFAGHVWTWDYPGKRLTLEGAGWRPSPGAKPIPLGFQSKDGQRTANFPRLTVTIAGEEMPMLLDTGAETYLTPEALAAISDGGPPARATSMIVASKVTAWRAAHPDWRVIEKGQLGSGSRMIEVPQVSIAGFEVGPVWFTERADVNFHDMMSSLTGGRVEGAIGGNAFHSLDMTVDYPAATAWFSRGTAGH